MHRGNDDYGGDSDCDDDSEAWYYDFFLYGNAYVKKSCYAIILFTRSVFIVENIFSFCLNITLLNSN